MALNDILGALLPTTPEYASPEQAAQARELSMMLMKPNESQTHKHWMGALGDWAEGLAAARYMKGAGSYYNKQYGEAKDFYRQGVTPAVSGSSGANKPPVKRTAKGDDERSVPYKTVAGGDNSDDTSSTIYSGGTPLTADQNGKIDPVSFAVRAREKIASSELNGFAPPSLKKFGIVNGTPDEWARFFTMIQQQESGHRLAPVRPDGSLARFATTPKGERSFGPGQFNIGEYGLKTWADVNNPDKVIDAYINVAKEGSLHNYFGSIKRPNETLQHSKWYETNVAPKLKGMESNRVASADPTFAPDLKTNLPTNFPKGSNEITEPQITSVPGTQLAQAQGMPAQQQGIPSIPAPSPVGQGVDWGQLANPHVIAGGLGKDILDNALKSRQMMQIPAYGGHILFNPVTREASFVPGTPHYGEMKAPSGVSMPTATSALPGGQYQTTPLTPGGASAAKPGSVEAARTVQELNDAGQNLKLQNEARESEFKQYDKIGQSIESSAAAASPAIDNLKLARSLVDKGAITGWRVGDRTQLDKILASGNITRGQAAAVSESLDKLLQGELVSKIKDLGGSGVGRVLASEVQALATTVANRGMDAKAIKGILDLNIKVHEREMALKRQADIYRKTHNGMLDRGWSIHREEYEKDNPLFTKEDQTKFMRTLGIKEKYVPHSKFPGVEINRE